MRIVIAPTALIAGCLMLVLTGGCDEEPTTDGAPPVVGPAAGASAEPATPRSISADSREVRFAVKGIHCQGCVNSIESSVGRVAGVRSVDVSLEGESARVRCSVETPMDAIVAAIGEAGYKATLVPAADAGAATMPPHEDRPGAD